MEKPIKADTFMSAKVDTCADVRVYGRTRSSVIQQALMTAQDRGFSPDYVTAWVDWWDKAAAVEREKAAAEQAVQAVPDTEAMEIVRRTIDATTTALGNAFVKLGGRDMYEGSAVPGLIGEVFDNLNKPAAISDILYPDMANNAQ